MQPLLNTAPVGKLCAPVAGNGFDQLCRECRQRSDNGVFHGFRSPVRHLHCNVKPGLALRQGSKAGFAFALAAHHRIRFPVPGFLAAVYRLVPFADRLPLAVFAPRFFHSVALPLAAQYFQIAVYQVFLVDPPIDGTPTGQLQFTRSAGDLLRRPGCQQLFLYVVDHLLIQLRSSVVR